jgi:hypothetical protein
MRHAGRFSARLAAEIFDMGHWYLEIYRKGTTAPLKYWNEPTFAAALPHIRAAKKD